MPFGPGKDVLDRHMGLEEFIPRRTLWRKKVDGLIPRASSWQACQKLTSVSSWGVEEDPPSSQFSTRLASSRIILHWSIMYPDRPASTRWSTTLSSKVNLYHAMNFRAWCSSNWSRYVRRSEWTTPVNPTVWYSRFLEPRTHEQEETCIATNTARHVKVYLTHKKTCFPRNIQ